MNEKYTELFRVPYSGSASHLREQIKAIDGVESVSLSTEYAEIESEVDCEIQYDTHLTDRTVIAQQIEGIRETGSVTFA